MTPRGYVAVSGDSTSRRRGQHHREAGVETSVGWVQRGVCSEHVGGLMDLAEAVGCPEVRVIVHAAGACPCSPAVVERL